MTHYPINMFINFLISHVSFLCVLSSMTCYIMLNFSLGTGLLSDRPVWILTACQFDQLKDFSVCQPVCVGHSKSTMLKAVVLFHNLPSFSLYQTILGLRLIQRDSIILFGAVTGSRYPYMFGHHSSVFFGSTSSGLTSLLLTKKASWVLYESRCSPPFAFSKNTSFESTLTILP